MDQILEGVIDIHIHTGPSSAEREVDVVQMLKLAEEAKYKAFVTKDHFFPTIMSSTIADRYLSNGNVRVFGGLCLNSAVGTFNLNAVDTAYKMGAKFISMPTVSSKQHIDSKHFSHSDVDSVPEKPAYYLTDDGELIPEVKILLDYLAKNPGMMLFTGHGCSQEIDTLIQYATDIGVKNIIVNHPFFATTNASMEQVVRWSKLGAFIELTAILWPSPKMDGLLTYDFLKEIVKNVSVEQLVINTDSGQKGAGSPTDMMRYFLKKLIEDCGISEKDINKMAKETPGMLLGI